MKLVKTNIGLHEIILPQHRADWWSEHPEWERKRLDLMFHQVGRGDVVYYVGAEEGDMPALCQMWGAKLILFEPNQAVWPNIKAIWDANNLSAPELSIQGFAGAITDMRQSRTPERSSFGPWAEGEVTESGGFKELSDPGEIGEFAIDTIVEVYQDIPTVICLDVEGSEWRVLEGAVKTLKKYKPRLFVSIHPEFMFRIYGEYQADLRKWIKDLGYREKLIDYEHEVHLFYD